MEGVPSWSFKTREWRLTADITPNDDRWCIEVRCEWHGRPMGLTGAGFSQDPRHFIVGHRNGNVPEVSLASLVRDAIREARGRVQDMNSAIPNLKTWEDREKIQRTSLLHEAVHLLALMLTRDRLPPGQRRAVIENARALSRKIYKEA